MLYQTLIDPQEAAAHLADPGWVFVDCRFAIRDPQWGGLEYVRSHIRGAVYAHLDRDLSGPIVPGVTGRHPLPAPAGLEAMAGRLGIGPGSQVVAYDESNGSMAAARLWWLLKWAGHDAAAVLDGGLRAWESLRLPAAPGVEQRPRGEFRARIREPMAVGAEDLRHLLDDPGTVVLDARTAERFHGINETIDPVAGHIPGAHSAPHAENVREDGRFRPTAALAELFARHAGGRDAAHVVLYCGSGVTAAHSVLAFAHAGAGMARLYPGSWSEWITDPSRPVSR